MALCRCYYSLEKPPVKKPTGLTAAGYVRDDRQAVPGPHEIRSGDLLSLRPKQGEAVPQGFGPDHEIVYVVEQDGHFTYRCWYGGHCLANANGQACSLQGPLKDVAGFAWILDGVEPTGTLHWHAGQPLR